MMITDAGWRQGMVERIRELMPGWTLCATVAMAAMFLSEHYGAPVMLFALFLGMAFNFIKPDGILAPGVAFTSRTVLRIGVALLGARITVDQVASLGLSPVLVAIAGVVLTILFGSIAARLFGFSKNFGLLTGGSVGICGASAALAISSVMPRGKGGITERDVIFTVLAVTTLSTVAMVLYPIIARALGMDDHEAGVFIGATIHDVAQVVGAGYSISTEAGDAATVTKLLRVGLLVPVVAVMTFILFRKPGDGGKAPRFPLFLICFVLLVILNSAGLLPDLVRTAAVDISGWALVGAIAALGVKTSLKELITVGPRAIALVVLETIWIAVLVLVLLYFLPF
ncbi:YeiH family protein [Telmatospirillum sp. J64-1]|uniref:YeiH family protein n=1 Tax=Telmatospirillum sp. J64-1 TaxID=2502183 RepID=UPI001C8F6B47|nr:putative sulfate exporter family transporter [Telmatospirillum sp. J64-1]